MTSTTPFLGNVTKKVSSPSTGWSTRRKIRTFGEVEEVPRAWSIVSRMALQDCLACCESMPLACQKYRICGGVTQQENGTHRYRLTQHSWKARR